MTTHKIQVLAWDSDAVENPAEDEVEVDGETAEKTALAYAETLFYENPYHVIRLRVDGEEFVVRSTTTFGVER